MLSAAARELEQACTEADAPDDDQAAGDVRSGDVCVQELSKAGREAERQASQD
jgi:hypothetical protein